MLAAITYISERGQIHACLFDLFHSVKCAASIRKAVAVVLSFHATTKQAEVGVSAFSMTLHTVLCALYVPYVLSILSA